MDGQWEPRAGVVAASPAACISTLPTSSATSAGAEKTLTKHHAHARQWRGSQSRRRPATRPARLQWTTRSHIAPPLRHCASIGVPRRPLRRSEAGHARRARTLAGELGMVSAGGCRQPSRFTCARVFAELGGNGLVGGGSRLGGRGGCCVVVVVAVVVVRGGRAAACFAAGCWTSTSGPRLPSRRAQPVLRIPGPLLFLIQLLQFHSLPLIHSFRVSAARTRRPSFTTFVPFLSSRPAFPSSTPSSPPVRPAESLFLPTYSRAGTSWPYTHLPQLSPHLVRVRVAVSLGVSSCPPAAPPPGTVSLHCCFEPLCQACTASCGLYASVGHCILCFPITRSRLCCTPVCFPHHPHSPA
jgi:hypothetical protein